MDPQAQDLKQLAAELVEESMKRGSFDGKKLTFASETVARVNSYLRDITAYLTVLGLRGNHYSRERIKMSDIEIDSYCSLMHREVVTLAVDALVWEAFLLMQDDKARRRGWLERFITRRRAPLGEQYERFSKAIKGRIYMAQGTDGPYPHIPAKMEVNDDEQKREEKPTAEGGEGELSDLLPGGGQGDEDRSPQGDGTPAGGSNGAASHGDGGTCPFAGGRRGAEEGSDEGRGEVK